MNTKNFLTGTAETVRKHIVLIGISGLVFISFFVFDAFWVNFLNFVWVRPVMSRLHGHEILILCVSLIILAFYYLGLALKIGAYTDKNKIIRRIISATAFCIVYCICICSDNWRYELIFTNAGSKIFAWTNFTLIPAFAEIILMIYALKHNRQDDNQIHPDNDSKVPCDNKYRNVSFVDCSKRLEKISDRQTLLQRIEGCRKSDSVLRDLDLSEVIDMENIDMKNLVIENVIFNYYNAENHENKELFNIDFKGSVLNRVSFAQCRLVRCNFDKSAVVRKEIKKFSEKQTTADSNNKGQPTIIKEADFFTCELISCRFRGTFLETADFRYSSFTDCSLGGCHIKYGDFYMASFKGTTNFIGSILSRCSLTNASFENNLPRIDSIDGLVQEYYQDYSDIIIGHRHWHKLNPCADFSCLNEAEDKNRGKAKSEAYIRKEAGEVYAQLSGFMPAKDFTWTLTVHMRRQRTMKPEL